MMLLRLSCLLAIALLAGACPSKNKPAGDDSKTKPAPTTPVNATVTISVLGTNDLHGHLKRLPTLAGFIHNLRARRNGDGGVLLLDAGDMFQGTLESNLTEGASIIDMYNAMGYTAATIGNHEFDFGPAGKKPTPSAPGDNPRGALEARINQAKFPLLAANIVDAATGEPPAWAKSHVFREVSGIKVALIGITTIATPYTTTPANFAGLKMVPLRRAIVPLAERLRKQGAAAVIVLAHAGGRCRGKDHNPKQLSACDERQEIFRLARKLPAGLIDVIVAGHTHAKIAHRVNGIAVIESLSKGLAFGRVDMVFDRADKRLTKTTIHPLRRICNRGRVGRTGRGACEPGTYEGKPVTVDASLTAMANKALAGADELRKQPLGVVLDTGIRRSRARESPLGNMISDLMRQARPRADVALTNGGGLRANLPRGPLTYGGLYEAQPFDNRFAIVKLTAAELARVLRRNLQRREGIFSISGIRAKATCEGPRLAVKLFRTTGKAIADTAQLVLATSDFLASGGDGAFGSVRKRDGAVSLESGETIRDAMADVLRKRGGHLGSKDFYDPTKKRLQFEGERPIRCR